ncbi:hypothetical protein BDZ94DRAFT_1319571 [Collybia nuda]|uniref:Chromatin assembly factor 1 subunit A dimerization domain-containing protein n=1 Tax=Collybia nuda TaxID=64659 RepID=A0A9P5YAD3_9AGAR|nr:hypothetical protein BDZ94DRAFT_1319571 [Collybia nuda]
MSGPDINILNGATGSTSEVKPHGASLAELKKGRVYFRQKPTSFEKQSETLQEIVKFREMLEDLIEKNSPPLTTIPDEHKPLIAKLAHESDKTLTALSKHIHHELLPAQDEDDDYHQGSTSTVLPLGVVEAAINTILQRNNYGLDNITGGKVPASLCVWRWEVKAHHRDWLPKNAQEKAESRQIERSQAKQHLLNIFQSLPQEEQNALVGHRSNHKHSQEAKDTQASTTIDFALEAIKVTSPRSKQESPIKQLENEENDIPSEATNFKISRPKKPIDPERAAKEKEKLEKKVARAEREKKEKEAQNKSRSLMANFLAKPQHSARIESKEKDIAVAGSSTIQSEFDKSFKPFILKKDTRLAPINHFLKLKDLGKSPIAARVDNGIIIIDDDDIPENDVEMQCMQTNEVDVTELDTQDHLRSVISSLPRPSTNSRFSQPIPHLKTYNPTITRDVVSQLSEAEITGDISLVRTLLSKLRNRLLLPAKVFIFTEDARPGYFGTWTRNSRIIGPRTPFAKDVLVFDYNYDSGEEWEEEPAGDADDVIEDAEDEDAEGSDPDSDLDSWLVDDDDDIEIPVDDKDLSPMPIPSAPQVTKRKAEESEKKLGKKRKVVVPLVPFARGPCWESSIGQCDYDLLKPYRIQMFNDTPFPIDPFTYVSTCIEDKRASDKASQSNGIFVIPNLPDHLATSNLSNKNDTSTTESPSIPAPSAPKKTTLAPKTPFPDIYLPLLLDQITSLQAVSITFLVEAIYRELREYKVKKNAIEAKVREVGEKCKQKKFWVVKPAAQAHRR